MYRLDCKTPVEVNISEHICSDTLSVRSPREVIAPRHHDFNTQVFKERIVFQSRVDVKTVIRCTVISGFENCVTISAVGICVGRVIVRMSDPVTVIICEQRQMKFLEEVPVRLVHKTSQCRR